MSDIGTRVRIGIQDIIAGYKRWVSLWLGSLRHWFDLSRLIYILTPIIAGILLTMAINNTPSAISTGEYTWTFPSGKKLLVLWEMILHWPACLASTPLCSSTSSSCLPRSPTLPSTPSGRRSSCHWYVHSFLSVLFRNCSAELFFSLNLSLLWVSLTCWPVAGMPCGSRGEHPGTECGAVSASVAGATHPLTVGHRGAEELQPQGMEGRGQSSHSHCSRDKSILWDCGIHAVSQHINNGEFCLQI